jgi:hypothetical protein
MCCGTSCFYACSSSTHDGLGLYHLEESCSVYYMLSLHKVRYRLFSLLHISLLALSIGPLGQVLPCIQGSMAGIGVVKLVSKRQALLSYKRSFI